MAKPQVLLQEHLKALRLPTFLREYSKLARQCASEGVDYPRYLLRLSELELLDRESRATERRIKAAKFPVTKSLDSFDFLALPSLNKNLVVELARCEYIDRQENVLALGNSGTGKTHVALALGLAACQRGYRVRFTTAAALVNELLEARDQKQLLRFQKLLAKQDLLIVDELGYVPLSKEKKQVMGLGRFIEARRQLSEHVGIRIGESGCAPVIRIRCQQRCMSTAPALNDKGLVLALECFGAADLAVKGEVLIVVMEVEGVDAVGLLTWMTDFIEAVGDRATVVIYDDTGPIAEQFEGVDYVVELGGKVATHEMIDAAAAAGITFWQIQGTGMDHVDIPYFEKKGIQIANTPGQFSSIALAEHAIYFTRISDLELRLEHGTPSLLLKAMTLPRKAGHDGIEGYSWPVLVVR